MGLKHKLKIIFLPLTNEAVVRVYGKMEKILHMMELKIEICHNLYKVLLQEF
jgi:hypothetical protein